jgi:hypothetical protein
LYGSLYFSVHPEQELKRKSGGIIAGKRNKKRAEDNAMIKPFAFWQSPKTEKKGVMSAGKNGEDFC